MSEIKLKRAYDATEPGDGYRIYIDRLWPRGLSHETFHYDMWDKDIAPTAELREWFHADPINRWETFKNKYIEELKVNPSFATLKQIVEQYTVVTLLYSSHDETHNNAVVVYDALNT